MLSKHRPVQQTKISANVVNLSPGFFALEVGRWNFFSLKANSCVILYTEEKKADNHQNVKKATFFKLIIRD